MKPGALLIRADANASIGTGHVMRCLALAQAWQEAGGRASFVFAELPASLQVRLGAGGFGAVPIGCVPGSGDDARETVEEARRANAGWVVVDGDRFHADFLDHLRKAGLRVLLIDDFAGRDRFPADLIVNSNLCAAEDAYRARGVDCTILTGPRFALLRKEFQGKDARESAGSGKRVLVTLGGSDPENLTPRLASALAKGAGLTTIVVAGAGYQNTAELMTAASPDLSVIVDTKSMASLMKQSDMAIIAAGGTLWELLAMECAVLSYSRNSVQRNVVRTLAKDHVVVDMGDTSSFDPVRLLSEVTRLAASPSTRGRMTTAGRQLVDGRGAARVVEVLRRAGVR